MAELGTESQLDLGIQKELDKIESKKYSSLEAQVKAEYNMAWEHQKPKKDESLLRLKLYNNQKRDKDKVGDTTLFTIHQTILASLYQDRLNVTFGAREEGDEEVADNLNSMAKFDYQDMGKDELDYDWIWDAAFFGRGLVGLEEYIREPENNIFLPVPQVYDPVTFLRDPRAVSINGDRLGYNSCRFYGREIKMTKDDMMGNPNFFDDLDFTQIKYGAGTKALLEDAALARAEAQGNQYRKHASEQDLGSNAEYDITAWNTHWKVDGEVKKVRVWLANNREKVVGFKELKHDVWPVLDRPLYPSSHDWDGTSIPDLTEDKQRARAVIQNLGLEAMKGSIYPMYIYDSNLIKNRNDLNFEMNKFIPVAARPSEAIAPLNKAQTDLGLLDFIYTTLDVSAQKATATPEIQQGQLSQVDRTLGEINLVASKVDTRYSLTAKIFGWSEKRFWRQWYQLYKDNFEGKIDKKILRLVGAFGAKWRPLKRENIIARIDPDVEIESQVLSRAKELEDRTLLTEYFALALAEPTANRRWGLKKLAKLNGLEKDEVERLFPPTIDERIAEDENDELSDDNFLPIKTEDDHNVHLEIHAKAADTEETYAHIEAHKDALTLKKTNPELFPEDQQDTNFQQEGDQPPVGLPPVGTEGAPIAPVETPGQPATAQPAPPAVEINA